MGWQERDYAKEPSTSYRGSFTRPYRGGGIRVSSVVKKLLIANIVIHVLATFTALGPYIYGYGVMQGSAVLHHGQVWRLLTATYLHAGLTHIFLNMLGLYFFGPPLEQVWGPRKFFVIYTLCGLLGNVLLAAACLLGWLSMDVPALGASGCVLGLLGAAAVLFPHAEVYIYFLFPVKIRTVALVLGVVYFLHIAMVVMGPYFDYRIVGTNYGGDICHFAGLVFGAWWAWRGDRWWAMRKLTTTPRGASQPQSRLWPGLGTGPWRQKVEHRVADEKTIDQILAKVREGGIGTLTDQEKKILIQATERLRQQEKHTGG